LEEPWPRPILSDVKRIPDRERTVTVSSLLGCTDGECMKNVAAVYVRSGGRTFLVPRDASVPAGSTILRNHLGRQCGVHVCRDGRQAAVGWESVPQPVSWAERLESPDMTRVSERELDACRASWAGRPYEPDSGHCKRPLRDAGDCRAGPVGERLGYPCFLSDISLAMIIMDVNKRILILAKRFLHALSAGDIPRAKRILRRINDPWLDRDFAKIRKRIARRVQ